MQTFHYLICAAIVLTSATCTMSAQTPLSEALRRTDIAPAWPGCDPKIPDCTKSRLADFIAANLQSPPEARAQGVGGVVIMEFVIEKNGTIGEVKALQDPGLGLGPEATRVITLMKTKKIKWVPAEHNGKRVAYRYVSPVSFSLAMPPKEVAPSTPAAADTTVYIREIAEVMPRFAGCDPQVKDSIDCTFQKVLQHIKTNLQYPEEAIKTQTHGQVVLEFVVDQTGAITDAKVIKGIGHGCDEEALRILESMPAWTPAMQDGKTVPVRMKLPILFQLPKQ